MTVLNEEALAPLTDVLKLIAKDPDARRELFVHLEKHGVHVMPVWFYSPIPDTGKLPSSTWQKASDMPGIDMNDSEQLHFIRNVLSFYQGEYGQYPQKATGNKFEFSYENDQFVGLDPAVLHSFIRKLKPNKIIEVGSGYSTLVTSNAMRLNGSGEIICIEPYPRDFIREGVQGVSRLYQCPVQDIDLSIFQELQENDILFIDSTHVAKIGSDVLYLFFEVLPRLKPGVLVHIHDIFFPHEYPEMWIREKNFFWSEQYILQAFLIGNSMFRVKYSVGYMGRKYKEELLNFFPNYGIGMGGGSFWMVKCH